MRPAICSFLALLCCPMLLAADNAYPRAELLLEPEQLREAKPPEGFVILDVRSAENYKQSHIPGAHRVDVGVWKTAFAEEDGADPWAQRIGNLGITRESSVVVYDDNLNKDAARVWWILRYWGVNDVRLLNAGWSAWQRIDAPLESTVPKTPGSVAFTPAPNRKRLVTMSSVLDRLDSLQIVDTRSEAEFCGIAQRSNKRGGAIPGATHLQWTDLIDNSTQRFKPAAELRKLFERAGVQLDQPIATHCQSGGRSSVMVFGLELMGAHRVQNYYAGWSEWGNAEDTPVVKHEPTSDGSAGRAAEQ